MVENPQATAVGEDQAQVQDATDWECAICHDLFDRPTIIVRCGHRFCSDCIHNTLAAQRDRASEAGTEQHESDEDGAGRCPMCRCCFEEDGLATDFELIQLMMTRNVACSNPRCGAMICASDWRGHQLECPEAEVSCPHVEHGCGFEGRRVMLDGHLESCPYEALKDFIGKTCHDLDHMHRLTHQLEALVEEQGQLLDALWPVSPLNPWNHLRFAHLVFWRWNQFPNEQARWLQSSFAAFVAPCIAPVFTVVPFALFCLSATLSPMPLPRVSLVDTAMLFGRGVHLDIPKWGLLIAVEGMCTGFLLELLTGMLPELQGRRAAILASAVIKGLVCAGSALCVAVMSPLTTGVLCTALTLPGSLALLGETEMDISRRWVSIGVLGGFVLTQSSALLLGTLIVGFKVLAIVTLSLFSFSQHSEDENLLIVGDQVSGGPFDVELRLQLNVLTSFLVTASTPVRQIVVAATAAFVPVVLYVGFPYLFASYGLFVIFHSTLHMLPPFVISSLRDSAQVGVNSLVCRLVYVFGLSAYMVLGLPGLLRIPSAMDQLADYIDGLASWLGTGLGPDF